MRRVVGFGKNNEENHIDVKPEEQLNYVDTIIQDLSKEIISCRNFESMLTTELKTITDMETNLQHISRQIEHMRKLVNTRDEIFRTLMEEYNKQDQMDITKCKKLFTSIEHISQEMNGNVYIATTELAKLAIGKQQKMYAASEENRKLMDIISENAKKLNTEIILLAEQHNSLSQRLKTLDESISKIEIERQRTIPT